MIDFLHIHENLENWRVGLVSVTEHLNTTTPYGRTMVDVLLSFAQYERELIGERTRVKMSAARRLRKWTGSMPPLGYDAAPEGGRLVVNRDESAAVETIFELYLVQGSLLAVVQELRQRGWRRKTWTTRDGTTLRPTTLTADEQRLILRAITGSVRDHTIISLALGTGLRRAEIVDLNVGDVSAPDCYDIRPQASPVRARQPSRPSRRFPADAHTSAILDVDQRTKFESRGV